jgi:hypothetical protein
MKQYWQFKAAKNWALSNAEAQFAEKNVELALFFSTGISDTLPAFWLRGAAQWVLGI